MICNSMTSQEHDWVMETLEPVVLDQYFTIEGNQEYIWSHGKWMLEGDMKANMVYMPHNGPLQFENGKDAAQVLAQQEGCDIEVKVILNTIYEGADFGFDLPVREVRVSHVVKYQMKEAA